MTQNQEPALSSKKLKLLAALRAKKKQNAGADDRPVPRAPGTVVPLSSAQMGVWFACREAGTSALFHIPLRWCLPVQADGSLLGAAMADVVARHETLRCAVVEEAGTPRLDVQPAHGVHTVPLDWGSCGDDEAETRRAALLAEGFALGEAPLWRWAVRETPAGKTELFVVLHHIISDGWSVDILKRELAAAVTARRGGQAPALPALPVQFGDVALWEQQWLAGAAGRKAVAFWEEQLRGARATELPTDAPRPANRTYAGTRLRFCWPEALAVALRDLCRQEQTTLYVGVAALWTMVLAHYSGSREVVCGTTVANRERHECRDLVGLFANLLVLRETVAEELRFSEWLARLNRTVLAAWEHQRVPFGHLVQELRPERDPRRSPFFQINLVLNQSEIPGETAVGVVNHGDAVALFDISLHLYEDGTGLAGDLVFNRDLYSETEARRWLDLFARLGSQAVQMPGRPLADFRHAEAVEAATLVRYPQNRTLHAWFAEVAKQHADAVALRCFDGEGRGYRLTYAALQRDALRLAGVLQARGVRRGDRVALLLPRDDGYVRAILAVLQCGAIYVPLAAHTPPERIHYIVADAEVALVVTHEALWREHRLEGLPCLCLDALPDESPEPVPVAVDPQQPAYLIYTSGTTGKPKGVQVCHANVVRLLPALDPFFDFSAADVWTLFHAFSFDFSVWEMWAPLLRGATCVVVPYAVSRSPSAFWQLCRQEGVTVLNQTPSAFSSLIEADRRQPEKLPLKTVIFAGEALICGRLAPWFDKYGDDPGLFNLYGITETTVHATVQRITRAHLALEAAPIGHTMDDMVVRVLDARGRPVAPGAVGELYFGGDCVSHGYWRRGALTAARFVPDPWSETPGARLYRGGDLGRLNRHGELVYLGRADRQVKIRGFRIELGEIENQLCRQAEIAEAAAFVRRDAEGGAALCAALVCAGAMPEPAEIRRRLLGFLPDYMVPALFVATDTLPMTVNGKRDTQALLALLEQTTEVVRDVVSPRNPIEQKLFSLFTRFLSAKHFGVDDHFFALGGDSLRAVQLCFAAEQEGLIFDVRDVFQNPTIARLAAHVGRKQTVRREAIETASVQLSPEAYGPNAVDAYPLSAMQRRMLQAYRDQDGWGRYHTQQCFTFRDPRFEPAMLEAALTHLITRHPTLRTQFDLQAGVQWVRAPEPVCLPVTSLAHLAESAQQIWIQDFMDRDRRNPFAIDQPDAVMTRFQLWHHGRDVWTFFTAKPHAVEDGWGNVQFLNDLVRLYHQVKGGMTLPAATVDPSYKEFIALEREQAQNPAGQAFWLKHTRGFSPLQRAVLPTPAARVRQPWRSSRLPEHVVTAVAEAAQARAVPLRAAYLSAWLEEIARLARNPRVCVALVANGRSPRLSNPLESFGLFWNLIPFCHDFGAVDAAQPGALWQAVNGGLVNVEPHTAYPVADLFPEERTFASLNFVHFHHDQRGGTDEPGETGFQLLGIQQHDRFHLPLNLLIAVHPVRQSVDLVLHYDPTYVSHAEAEAVLARTEARIAASVGTAHDPTPVG
ncbi:non-ribosomal peptide synthetase [Acanthopleuribacter pedis]|uniref:Amino acid adenylation domain-containing protein n=1 Tax=Acanthopleuribacter pedis TaxID=442870 RepID=A0A8J7Q708_9BACT|nr:non-ribosomal peptide synthetase [Acanthopleuribacter pedis]MBO1319411.1 amino acid adenylation domain-containing protein [Acanthopleuribacter pedis]